MQFLARLACPPNGTILDPFMGSGSTLVAAIREGFDCLGMEQEERYFRIAEARVADAENRVGLFAAPEDTPS